MAQPPAGEEHAKRVLIGFLWPTKKWLSSAVAGQL